jgi:hypothetical protein
MNRNAIGIQKSSMLKFSMRWCRAGALVAILVLGTSRSTWGADSVVGIFDHPAYVDTTSGGVGAESDNLQATLSGLGFPIVTFTNLVAATGAYRTIVIPEQELRPLVLDLTAGTRSAVSNYVFNGGKLIVHGTASGASASLLNAVFGFQLGEAIGSGNLQSRTEEVIDTEFEDDPAFLFEFSATTIFNPATLPPNSASLYASFEGSAVVLIQVGSGFIVFIGWDWYDAQPNGNQNDGWLDILQSAVLQGPRVPRPPFIHFQPVNQITVIGGMATFSVGVKGTAPLSYQWRRDGTNITDATNATYTLFNAQSNDVAQYSVVVTNLLGSDTSSGATLTVLPASAAVAVFDDPNYVDSSDTIYAESDNVQATVRTFGFPAVAFTNFSDAVSRYQRIIIPEQENGALAFDLPSSTRTALSNFVFNGGKLILHGGFGVDSFLNAVFGFAIQEISTPGAPHYLSSSANGTEFSNDPPEITENDFTTQLLRSSLPDGALNIYTNDNASAVVLIEHGSGLVLFLGWDWSNAKPAGSMNGGWLNVLESALVQEALPPRPPVITLQPASQSVIAGGTATFSVGVGGTVPFSFQWRRAGTNIINATNNSFIIPNVQNSHVGNYSVVVTNLYGSTTSVVATLTLLNLNGVVAYFSDNFASATGPEGPIVRAGFLPLHVTNITTFDLNSASMLFINEVDNGTVSTALRARLPAIQTWVNGGGKLIVHDRATGNLNPNPFLLGTTGITSTRFTTSDLNVIPPGDNLVINGPFGVINNTTLDGGSSSAHGYISRAQLPADTVAILSTEQGPTNVVSFMYQLGSGFVYYSSIPLDCYLTNGGCGGNVISAPLQNIYTPNVLAYVASVGICSNCPPRFTVQPLNQNVLPGTNVSLVAAASGTGPIRYQWRFEGTNIPNATNATYSFTNASLANHGFHSVTATDDNETTVSSNAFIYVLVRPGFLLNPVPQTVLQGRTATFTAIATGAPPIWYRWLTNGVGVITNDTGILVLTNVQSSYTVRATATNRATSASGVNMVPSGGVLLTMLPDFDRDGMADAWERQYGFATNNAADALLDFDGDGMINRDEYIAGTAPTNATSLLKIVLTATNTLWLEFVAQTNISYTVQRRTNLFSGSWENVTNIAAASVISTVKVNTATAPTASERYYRVATLAVPSGL